MSSVSIYALPKYQTHDLELNLPGYHELIFVDYKNRQVLKEFKSSERPVRAVFVGRGTRDVYEWINYEGILYECYWSGPMGKYCELCKQFGIEEFPHYLVFRNDSLLYSKNEPPSKELKNLGLSSSEEFAKEILYELISGLLPEAEAKVHKVEFSHQIAELQNQLNSVASICEEQKKMIENLQTTLNNKEEEISQYKKKLYIPPKPIETDFKQLTRTIQPKPDVPSDTDFWNIGGETLEDLDAPNKYRNLEHFNNLWITSAEKEPKKLAKMSDDIVGDMLKTSKLADISPQFRSNLSVDIDNFGLNKRGPYEFLSPQNAKKPSLGPELYTPNPAPKIPIGVSPARGSLITSNTTFFEQRVKHMQKFLEKQPLGRDGKRIPPKDSRAHIDSNFSAAKRNPAGNLGKYGGMVMSHTRSPS